MPLRTGEVTIRPIAALLLALTLGIFLAPIVPWSPPVCYVLATLAVALSLPFLSTRFGGVLLMLPLILIGIGRTRDVSLPHADDISRYAGRPSVWVRGEVASLVEAGTNGSWTFTLAADEVNDFQTTRPVSGKMRVTLRRGREPAVGEVIRVRGKVEEFEAVTNPGAFDYDAYMARHGSFCRMTVRYPEDMQSTGKRTFSLWTVAQSIRRAVLAQTAANLYPEDVGLLDSLLLSVRARLPAALDNAFQRTGTVHILSVSGLHLTAFAGVLVWLFRILLLPRPIANLASIVLIWLFALAAGASAAPLRAAVMATVFLAAPLLRRTAEPLHAFAFAALVLLFADPGALYDAGFQLSFASVGGLLLFVGPLSERYLPVERGQTRWQRLGNGLLLLLVVGVVAELSTAPLTAYHFNTVSLIGPIANVLIAVWSEWLLLLGLATVIVSPIVGLLSPAVAHCLWWPLAWGLWLLRFLAAAFSALPFAALVAPSLPVMGIVGYYGALALIAWWLRRSPRPTS